MAEAMQEAAQCAESAGWERAILKDSNGNPYVGITKKIIRGDRYISANIDLMLLALATDRDEFLRIEEGAFAEAIGFAEDE